MFRNTEKAAILGSRPFFIGCALLVSVCALTGLPARAETELPPFKLGLSTQAVATGFKIQLKPGVDGAATALEFRPAESNYAGIVLGYRWLSGTVSFAVPAKAEIRDVEGVSEYRDYRISYFNRQFGIEGGYNHYLGYLIDNSATLSDAARGGQRYYKLPSLETVGYGANFFYAFSPETYSMPAAIDQSAIEERSGGSWLFMASWRNQDIHNLGAILPAEVQSSFGADQTLELADTFSGAAGAGYGHHWAWGSFFISPVVAATVGYSRVNFRLADGDHVFSSGSGNAHVRLALGWNARTFFAAVSAYYDLFSQDTRSLQIDNEIYGATVAGGLRF